MEIITVKSALVALVGARLAYGVALDNVKTWRVHNDAYWMGAVIIPAYNKALENLSNAYATYKLAIAMGL